MFGERAEGLEVSREQACQVGLGFVGFRAYGLKGIPTECRYDPLVTLSSSSPSPLSTRVFVLVIPEPYALNPKPYANRHGPTARLNI